jgi:predicted ester cyclase
MSATENKTTIRRLFEEFWDAGNLSVADELLHPEYVFEGKTAGRQSAEAVKEAYAFWLRVVPDMHFTLDEITAEGDTVVARWTGRGTQQGEWLTPIGTVPATGKPMMASGTNSYHFKDGKIIRDVAHVDFLSTLQQLGVVIQAGETVASTPTTSTQPMKGT